MSIGHHSDPVERYETETFTIFVDELMTIPATTVGTAFDLDGAGRNGLGMHFTDRGTGSAVSPSNLWPDCRW